MSRSVTHAGWGDVPHITDEMAQETLDGVSVHEHETRRDGMPGLGEGAIYPIKLDDILIEPIQIQPFWKKIYGLDVGWNVTAAVWGAWNTDEDVLYLYSEHYGEKVDPAVNSAAIRARGDWIPGEIDPASRGRSQTDGKKLFDIYQKQGLKIRKADNAVSAGLTEVEMRLSTGRLKVFNTLSKFQYEYRLYRREKGLVVKKNDHILDAARYLVMGLHHARTKPAPQSQIHAFTPSKSVTGY